MQIKKLVLAGAAAALVGGFAFAPNATAAEGECDEVQRVDGVLVVHGESPETAGEGCLVLEGDWLPVNPLDDGHVGIYDDGGDPAPGLYGSCDGREPVAEDTNQDGVIDEADGPGTFKPLPGEEDPDFTKCAPGA